MAVNHGGDGGPGETEDSSNLLMEKSKLYIKAVRFFFNFKKDTKNLKV